MRFRSNANTGRRPLISPADRENLAWFSQGYLKDKLSRLILILLLVISQGAVYQQFLSLTDQSLRVIFENGAVRDLIWICAMVGAVFIYRGITAFLVPWLSARISTDVIFKLRSHLSQHVIGLDLAFFERTPPGEMVLRLVRQAESIAIFIGQSVVRALRDVATIVIVSIYLFWKQPLLFLVALLVIPVIILALQVVSKRVRKVQAQVEGETGAYIDTIDEVVSGIRTVKISNQEELEMRRLSGAADYLRSLNMKLMTAQAAAQPFIDFAAAFVYMLVIGGGGYAALHPDYDVDGASIITFLLGLILIFDPGRRLAQFWVTVQGQLVVLDALRGLLTQKPDILDDLDAVTEFDPTGDLSLSQITFGYDQDAPLFSDLSLTFKSGATTAIVGTTGSGKTTILSLLARLYDPAAGQVTLAGRDIKTIKQTSLRGAFSVVSQDIVIFNASIRDNIAYGRDGASDADIDVAAKSAEIFDLMTDRGDTPVGPRGAQLSGGQKQRIAIARAFLSAAPIVFLDEATSALDQATEEKITRALKRLAQGRTTIMVAHRLSTVRDADYIYVLETGRLAEEGTHKTLMRARGLYATLYKAQEKNYRRRFFG